MSEFGTAMKTTNPNEVRYCCPECGDEGFHMYLNLAKKVWHCFKCGARGLDIPEKLYSEGRFEEVHAICMGKKKEEEAEHTLFLPAGTYDLCGDDASVLAIRYMAKRGIPLSKIRSMNCMVSTDPKHQFRIIMPVYNKVNDITFYQARGVLKSVDPKYLNPQFPKRDSLWFNFNSRRTKHLFVVEGIFKALQLWKIDMPAVAILGKEFTREQILRLRHLAGSFTIMLDPDARKFGVRAVDELGMTLAWGQSVTALFPDKSPDDMHPEDLKKFIHKQKGDLDEVLQERA